LGAHSCLFCGDSYFFVTWGHILVFRHRLREILFLNHKKKTILEHWCFPSPSAGTFHQTKFNRTDACLHHRSRDLSDSRNRCPLLRWTSTFSVRWKSFWDLFSRWNLACSITYGRRILIFNWISRIMTPLTFTMPAIFENL
jgi:hypothetical protein